MSQIEEAQPYTPSHAARMSDANVRVEKMFWIPGLGDQPTNEFEEFVEDELAEAKAILSAFPWLSGLEDADLVLEEFAARRVGGFLVQLATPIPSSIYEDGAFSFSGGHYRM